MIFKKTIFFFKHAQNVLILEDMQRFERGRLVHLVRGFVAHVLAFRDGSVNSLFRPRHTVAKNMQKKRVYPFHILLRLKVDPSVILS